MNKRTTCLLRRLLISQKLGQTDLIHMMEKTHHTDAEIAEVFKNRPVGDRIYILHGYWNTPDTDGVQIIKVSYDAKAVEQRLSEIAESNASEFVSLTEENWQAVGGDRHYEITDEVGNYAKFYITEEVADYEG